MDAQVFEVPGPRRRFLTDRVPLLQEGEPGRHEVTDMHVVPVSTNQGKRIVVAFTLRWTQPQWWPQTWVMAYALDDRLENPQLIFESAYDEFATLIDAAPVDDQQACVLLYASLHTTPDGLGPNVRGPINYRLRKIEPTGLQHPAVDFLEGEVPAQPGFAGSLYRPIALGGIIAGRGNPMVLALRDPGEFGDAQSLIAIRLRANDLQPISSIEIDKAPNIAEAVLSRVTEPRTDDTDEPGWIGAYRLGDIIRWFLVRPLGDTFMSHVDGHFSLGSILDVADLQVDGGRYERDPATGLIVYRFCVAFTTTIGGERRLKSQCSVFRGVQGLEENTETLYGPTRGGVRMAVDTHSQCHWMLVDQGGLPTGTQARDGPTVLLRPTNVRRLGATGTAYAVRQRSYLGARDVAFDHYRDAPRKSRFITGFVADHAHGRQTIRVEALTHSRYTQAYRTEFGECPMVRPFDSQYVHQLQSVPLVGHARMRLQLVGGPADGRFVWLRLGPRLLKVAPCEPAVDLTAPGAVAIQVEPDASGAAEVEVPLSEVLLPNLFRKEQVSYRTRGEILDYPNLLFAQWVWFTPSVRTVFNRGFEFDFNGRRIAPEDGGRFNSTTIELNLDASNVHWLFINE